MISSFKVNLSIKVRQRARLKYRQCARCCPRVNQPRVEQRKWLALNPLEAAAIWAQRRTTPAGGEAHRITEIAEASKLKNKPVSQISLTCELQVLRRYLIAIYLFIIAYNPEDMITAM
jgi:hypothetical protein